MIRRLRGLYSPANKTLVFFVIVGAAIFAASLLGQGHAFADCNGINTGDIHDYAGLKVISQWVDDSGNTRRSDNTDVRVTEHNGGASDDLGGNIIVMSQVTNNTSAGRYKARTFHQFKCSAGAAHNIVLLPGATGMTGSWDGGSVSNDWGLDCDNSRLGNDAAGNPIFQQFDVTGIGVPNGARPGGHWDIQTTARTGSAAAANGTTLDVTITYTQPPPPPPTSGSGSCFSTSASDSGIMSPVVMSSPVPAYPPDDAYNPPSQPSHTDSWSGAQNHVDISGAGQRGNPSEVWTHTVVNVTDSSGHVLVNNGVVGQGYVKSHTWTYSPLGQSVTVTFDHREHLLTHNGNEYWVTYATDTTTYPCYSASCQILSVTGDGPQGVVESGGTIHVYASITNTGPQYLPPSINGWNLGLTGMGSPHPYGGWLSPSSPWNTGYMWIDIPAPAGPSNYGISFYPDYYGGFTLGSACTANAAVYAQFNVSVGADVNAASWEDPTTISYDTYVSNSSGVTVYNDPTTSEFYGTHCATVGPVGNNGPWGGGNTYTLNSSCSPSPINAGDTYCAYISITYTSGWIGPGNDLVGGSGGQTVNPCKTVINRPFYKAYAGGVSAGGTFTTGGGSTCTGGGSLGGWFNNMNAGYNFGASAQLKALALSNIIGFASNQYTSRNSPTGLTFANSGVSVTNDPYNPNLGGSYGGTQCLPTASPAAGARTLRSNPYTISTSDNGSYQAPGASLTISGGTIGVGKNVTIYVNGDVTITSNITYQNSGPGGWTKQTDVPSFVLIATGNIHISKNVTELDGFYTAQPNSGGTGGEIYTCQEGESNNNVIYGTCNQQLTVYGSFVANQVNMMRTFGSLRDEASGAPRSCSNNGGGWLSRQTCAAEVFILSPELYLSTPSTAPPSSGAVQYDAITSLPPVL